MAAITGTSGNDTLIGTVEDDILRGLEGDDVIEGGGGKDRYEGGEGDDIYIVNRASDLVAGEYFDGQSGAETVRLAANGDTYDLRVVDFYYVERLDFASAGTATLLLTGNQTGTLRFDLSTASVTVRIYLNESALFDPFASQSWDLFLGFGSDDAFFLEGRSTGDTITAPPWTTYINAGGGNDLIYAGAGNDTLVGGAGADQFVFGRNYPVGLGYPPPLGGVDRVLDFNANEDVLLLLDTLSQSFFVGEDLDVDGAADDTRIELLAPQGVTNTVYLLNFTYDQTINGTAGNDVLTGTQFAEVINGGDGNDILRAAPDNVALSTVANGDTLRGEGGDDTLVFLTSRQHAGTTFDGGAGFDTLRVVSNFSSTILDLAQVNITNIERIEIQLSYLNGGTITRVPVAMLGAALPTALTFVGTAVHDTVEFLMPAQGSAFDLRTMSFENWTAEGFQADGIIVRGAAGADIIYGGALSALIQANGGNDTIYAGSKDAVRGDDGDDLFVVSAPYGGQKLVDGGGLSGDAGEDTLRGVVGAGQSLTLELLQTATNFEKVEFASDQGAQLSIALNYDGFGNYWAPYAVRIKGGAGVDTLIMEENSSYRIMDASIWVFENWGPEDRIELRGRGSVIGTAYDDVINFVLSSEETAFGGAGNDTLYGSTNPVGGTLQGGVGNDIYILTGANDTIRELAGEGHDVIRFAGGALKMADNVEDLVSLATAASWANILGNDLANRIETGAGNDVLNGGGGSDLLIGGLGDDIYYIDPTDGVVDVGGRDMLAVDWSFRLWDGFEDLQLLGTAPLDGIGNSLANRIYGNSAANRIDGAAGADLMIGGAGNDIYFADNVGDMVFERPGEGVDTIVATASHVMGNEVEVLYLVGDAAIDGLGNGQANRIFGNSAANRLDGGNGADLLIGGGGNDVYVIDDPGDRVIENVGEGLDVVIADYSHELAANVEYLYLRSLSAYDGVGNDLDNRIFGNMLANRLDGRGGADLLIGASGDDLYITDAQDMIIENPNEGTDWVLTSEASYTLGANLENLVYGGSGSFTGNGNGLNNRIQGGNGADVFSGFGGDDFLIGGRGADTFDGGAGIDVLDLGPGGSGDDDLVLVRTSSGDQVLFGFEAGGANDRVSLIGTSFSNFDQVKNALKYDAEYNTTFFAVDADTNIFFYGLAPHQFLSVDFLFS